MKKTYSFRLFLTVLFAALFGFMSAETVVTFDAGTDKGSNGDTSTASQGDRVEKDGVTISVNNGLMNVANTATYVGAYRIYKNATLTVSSTNGNITKIEISCTASGSAKYGPGSITASGYTAGSDANGVWSGDAATVELTATNNQARIEKIVVTVGGEPGEVTPGGGGEDPGQGGGDPVVTGDEMTIAELNALTENKANIVLKLTDAQVVYSAANTGKSSTGGNDVYIREGDKAIMFYDTKLAFNVGDILNGKIAGDFAYYYGIPEIKDNSGSNLSSVEATPGTAVVPTETTVEDILALKHVADLVLMRNVTITAEGSNYYANQNGNKVQLYKGIDVSAYATGQNYNVTAVFNNIYSGRAEVAPVAVEAGVYIVPAPVITPNGGTFNGPVEVSIEGNGNMVFYTIDGSEPSYDATEYEGPFTITESAVVKAIAYDNDLMESEIATAEFTISQATDNGYPLPFNEEFDNGASSFSVQNGGDVAIWGAYEFNGDKGMLATGYINKAYYESEAWLVSPVIDLTNVQGATMTVTEEVNMFFGNASEEATVWVREAVATPAIEWVQLPVTHPTVDDGKTWSAVTPIEFSLNDFAGKAVQIGFKYTSTSSVAGSWVIFGVKIEDNGGEIVMTAPTFTPEGGTYDDDVEVTIVSANGMDIRYTTDGTEPTQNSTLYTEPIVISETTTVKAVAVRPTDGALSPVATATYTIDRKIDGDVTSIDFVNNPWGITPSDASNGDQGNITEPLVWNGVTISFDTSESSAAGKPRLYTGTGSSNYTTLRFYKDQIMEVAAPAKKAIAQVIFYSKGASSIALTDESGAEVAAPAKVFRAPVEDKSTASKKWTPSTPVLSQKFKATASVQLTEMEVILVDATGIESVTTESKTGKAIFDLQGRRVQQPAKGLYIIDGKKVILK